MKLSIAKRDVALFLAGAVVAGFFITPVGAHVGGSVAHLWSNHIRPKVTDLVYTKAQSNNRYLMKEAKAADADELDGKNSTEFAPSQAEAWHNLAANEFSSNCWTNTGAAGRNTAGYFRDLSGIVHLKGYVRHLAGEACTSPVIFTLPVGYRPLGDENQIVSNGPIDTNTNTMATITIVRSGADAAEFRGEVTFVGGNMQDLFLDGISFRCAPSGVDGCP